MKGLKVIAAILLSLILLGVQSALMCTFAVDKSLSPEATEKAVRDSDFAAQIYQQTADQNTNVIIQEQLKKALRTDAATKAIANYISGTSNAILHGTTYQKYSKADLLELSEQSLDELSSESGISPSKSQKKLVLNYIEQDADTIVKAMNEALPVPEEDISDTSQMYYIQKFFSAPTQVALALSMILLGIFLIALFWKSKLGFIWWAVTSALCGWLFLSISFSTDSLVLSQVQTSAAPLEVLIVNMIQAGTHPIGIIALVWSLVLIVLCIVLRRLLRRPLTV